jgi:hypothetical protein
MFKIQMAYVVQILLDVGLLLKLMIKLHFRSKPRHWTSLRGVPPVPCHLSDLSPLIIRTFVLSELEDYGCRSLSYLKITALREVSSASQRCSDSHRILGAWEISISGAPVTLNKPALTC